MKSQKANYVHNEITHNEVSASIILPLVFDIIRPKSILDVGCGIGTWLSVSKKLGISQVLGLDGDYVDRSLLHKYLLDQEFRQIDLLNSFNLNLRFDLSICLEVVEHLPESSAENIVNSLIIHSDAILFSAAIPGQGGQNHLNEQYPEYWSNLFKIHDYYFYDLIRPKIWDNENIDFWYKQNIFLVCKRGVLDLMETRSDLLLKIHPQMVLENSFERFRILAELNKKNLNLSNINGGKEKLSYYLKLLGKYFVR